MSKIIQLEGRNVITEALNSGRKMKKILVDKGGESNDKIKNILRLA
ncbi:hypothetical protein KC660_04555, partial [Candidatus Dojkabacteria bacterium]|nr:hypothetical protein [Candidatus Dojkabacteria bacterium]